MEPSNEASLILPDGTVYKFPYLKGTDGPAAIDIRSLYTQTGCFTLDPGYASTASCVSSITYADGEKGQL